EKVIAFARKFLDDGIPLAKGSHADASAYSVHENALRVTLDDGSATALADPGLLLGWRGDASAPEALVFRHHGLHFEVQIDKSHAIDAQDKAGVKDVVLESAITTIMDCEDSIATVDAQDKVLAYRNWLGLMQGNLSEEVSKGGKTFTRRLNPDRSYTGVDGQTHTLHG